MRLQILTTTLLIVVFSLFNTAIAQITGPGAIVEPTVYTDGSPNDNIYIFCSNPGNPVTGTLEATPTGGTGPYNFTWYTYNTGTNSYDQYTTSVGATSTISGLGDGGYFVTITDNAGNSAGCQLAWVYINETEVDAGTGPITGCDPFTLNGTANPFNNFTYYNPPPQPLLVDANTEISVSFDATHTFVSDLGYFLVGPAGCGSPVVTLAPNPEVINANQSVCNAGEDVSGLTFTTNSNAYFDVCSEAVPISGVFGGYGPAGTGTDIDWSVLYGCDAAEGGWSVQIYDCIGSDVGSLTNATININGNTSCGPVNVTYDSGPINSAINDNSCDGASASIFTVPPPTSITTPITLNNSIVDVQWSTGDNSLTSNVNTAPTADTWYYFSATDNFGCTHQDSILFTNTCVCNFTAISANIQAADCNLGTFSIDGSVEFENAPTTGTLTITNCSGDQEVFNAPFTSPQAYNITDIPADGTSNCSVTAVFSDDPACTIDIGPFTEPICVCTMTNFNVNIGLCDPASNEFEITGDLEFQSPPATGTLVVEDCNGNSAVFNPPFTSPQAFTISNIPSDATLNCDLTAYFTDDPTCTINVGPYDNPGPCGCEALIGNFTNTQTGSGSNNGVDNFVLCFGDQIDLNSDLDYTPPQDLNIGGVTYDPGLAYLVYTCPPTVLPPNELWDSNTGLPVDPCLIGIASFGDNFTDQNVTGNVPFVGTYADNTAYYVPITTYSNVDGFYAISINGGDWCYDMGDPFSVQYLPEVTSSEVQDCFAGTVTITVNGGLPEIDAAEVFTGTNLMPLSASFDNTTAGHAGTIVISGLQDGDMYSFDITDANGCPHTFTGGPFVGVPTANAGPDDEVCSLTYTLQGVASFGTGTWTGPAGITFGTANSATSTVTANAPGTYTLTWTEDNGGGCISTDDVDITFSDLQYAEVINNSTCGNADGSIVINATDGIAPYSYSIDAGVNTQTNGTFNGLAQATYNIQVEDAIGCQLTGTAAVNDLGGPTIDAVNTVDVTCFGDCDGSIAINATGATQFSIDNGNTLVAVSNFANLCQGTYDIVVQDALGCQATSTATINEPDELTHTTTHVDLLCSNQCIGEIDITANGGSAPYAYSIDNGATTQLNGLFQNLCAGTYDVLITDASGCTSTSQVILTEPNPLSVTISITDAICFGQCNGIMNSIPAGGAGNGPGDYSYIWTPAVGGNVPLVTNLCAGTYDLSIQDANGCTLDTNGIVVGAPQAVTIDNVATVDETCGGDCTGSLEIFATGAIEYSLDGITYQPANSFTNLCAGSYTLYAQDANGCQATSTATIAGPDQVLVQAYSDTLICIGGTASLSADAIGGVGGYTFAWDNGDMAQNINVSPGVTQSYCVTATDLNGCSSPVSCVTVNVGQPLNLLAFSDISICEGETADISALVLSGGDGGPYNYTWDQGVGAGSNQTVQPAFTTTYTVTASDNCETPDATASVTITVNTIPSVSFTADNLDGCYPVSVNFTEQNVPAGSTCLWSFGDGGVSTDCQNVSYDFVNPGCWDVTLNVTTPDGCQTSSTIPSYICVYDYPQPQFEFGPQPTSILDPEIDFTNLTTGINGYTWHFDTQGANDSSNIENPSYTFPDPGYYEVCLNAISAEGCPGVICDTVEILDEFLLYVPNAFTPDGDDVNDVFTPIVSGITPNSYEFLVFNRWGQLIYQSQIVGEGWDGTFKNFPSQQDVYVWKIKVADQFGKEFNKIGHVTLIR